MSGRLVKTKAVLKRVDEGASAVTFGDTDEEGVTRRILTLARELVADLGEPFTITVTVRPGDTLNPPEAKS